jgi:hypothetical protein
MRSVHRFLNPFYLEGLMLDKTLTLEEELKRILLTKYSLRCMVSALRFNIIS